MQPSFFIEHCCFIEAYNHLPLLNPAILLNYILYKFIIDDAIFVKELCYFAELILYKFIMDDAIFVKEAVCHHCLDFGLLKRRLFWGSDEFFGHSIDCL